MAVIGSKPPEAQPFFEPPMAVIGSKPPEAILKFVILGGVYGRNYTFGAEAALDGPIPAQ